MQILSELSVDMNLSLRQVLPDKPALAASSENSKSKSLFRKLDTEIPGNPVTKLET